MSREFIDPRRRTSGHGWPRRHQFAAGTALVAASLALVAPLSVVGSSPGYPAVSTRQAVGLVRGTLLAYYRAGEIGRHDRVRWESTFRLVKWRRVDGRWWMEYVPADAGREGTILARVLPRERRALRRHFIGPVLRYELDNVASVTGTLGAAARCCTHIGRSAVQIGEITQHGRRGRDLIVHAQVTLTEMDALDPGPFPPNAPPRLKWHVERPQHLLSVSFRREKGKYWATGLRALGSGG